MHTEGRYGTAWLAASGAIIAGTGVAVGAFGAHAIEARLSTELMAVFETGARYHLIHGVAVLAVAALLSTWPGRLGDWGGWLLVAGTIVFSGSLYALALSGVTILGAVTPVGGLLLLVGWTALGVHLWRSAR